MGQYSEKVAALGELDLRVNFTRLDVFHRFPEEVGVLLGDPETLRNETLKQSVLSYTTTVSLICYILHHNPASDSMLRIVYPDRNSQPIPPDRWLDLLLSRSFSGQALRDRLDLCSGLLAREYFRSNTRGVDLGGGSGSYFFEAARLGSLPTGLLHVVIDLDPEALAAARWRVQSDGLALFFQTLEANFMKNFPAADKLYDYAVLIGVLCGMDHETAVRCLVAARKYMKPGGKILAATLLQRAFDEDPVTFWLLCCIGGWQLRPKSDEEVLNVFAEAGWTVESVLSERASDPGQYAIIQAVNK